MASTGDAVEPTLAVDAAPLESVTFDFYRHLHKGLRSELFALTYVIGRLDPADDDGLAAARERWHDLVYLLEQHAFHEETIVQPLLEQVEPELAARVVPDHRALDARVAAIGVLFDRALAADTSSRRVAVHRLYLGLTELGAEYLQHFEFEELEIIPALSVAVPVEQLVAMNSQVVDSISAEDMVENGKIMLPAMNVEDRVELIGGIQDRFPPDVFLPLWHIVETFLEPDDARQLAARLGIEN
jgi:hypothetical protein